MTVLVLIEMWNSLNALSENQSIFKIGIFSNLFLWFAIFLSILVHTIILYIPYFNKIFDTVPLTIKDWI